jgi:tripartite-type tricarboxylate transporter receptor subunit TctC
MSFPFKSGPDAAIAVLGGHVHATTENLADVLPQVESKKYCYWVFPLRNA